MIDIFYRNYSSTTGQSRYQDSNRSRKNSSSEAFKTTISGNVVYIEQTSVGKGITWDDIKKIPGKYALKDGNSISFYHSTGNCGYKFYHAAESTDDSPVLIAKGVDEHGMYFEEKINVKQINPYNTSTLELQALAHFKPGEYKTLSNPYDCMQGQEKGLRERFNFISGTQSLINAWKRIGHAGQAAQWNDELSFLLSYTEQKTHGYSVDNSLNRISDSHNKNAELYFNAAKERLITSITKCSENLLDLL